MPIYEYHCQQCDAEFELLVRSANDKVKCPKCAGRRVRRKLSMFAVSSSGKDGGQRSTGSSCSSCSTGSCAECGR